MKPEEPLVKDDRVCLTYDPDTCGTVVRLGAQVSVIRISGTFP